jgi:general secretion pathway protein D
MTSPTQRRARPAAAALCALALTLNVQAQQSATTPVTEQAAPLPRGKSLAASDAYLAGAKALDHNDAVTAERDFAHAATLDPNNPEYAQAVSLAREHRLTDLVHRAADARLRGRVTQADALLAEARTLDPQSPIVAQHQVLPRPTALAIEPQRGTMLADAIAIQPDTKSKKSFHIRGSAHDVITQVERAYGITVTFDESATNDQLRYDLEDVTYGQAVPTLFSMAKVFGVPLDEKTLLIAKESVENRQRFDHLVLETIYIPGQTVTQLQDIANVVRNVFDVKLLTVQQAQSSLVLRTTPETAKVVNLVLADLLDGGSEIMLEMQIYSVDMTHSRDIGFQPPQFGAYNISGAAHSFVQANQSLVDQAIAQGLIPAGSSDIAISLALIASGLASSSLLSSTIAIFGGSINPTTGAISNQFTTTGITSTSVFNFNLSLNSSESHALDDLQMRVGDREQAIFRTGSRYPITTSTYSTPSASALAGVSVNGSSAASLLQQYLGTNSTTTIPQIAYEDLGLTLKATPTVQKSGRVFMHLDLKLEALGGTSLNNIPILNSRTLTSDVTVADGESALLVSTLSKSETTAVTGLPGLSELPGFQAPTEQNGTRDSSELVILVTPHVVRHRVGDIAGPRIAFNLPPSQRTD